MNDIDNKNCGSGSKSDEEFETDFNSLPSRTQPERTTTKKTHRNHIDSTDSEPFSDGSMDDYVLRSTKLKRGKKMLIKIKQVEE